MKCIILLTDYKGFFGSKQKSKIYRGGMDISRITDFFSKSGYQTTIMPLNEVTNTKYDKEKAIFIYTSAEDKSGLYKSFIEDIIFHLEEQEYKVIPAFRFLKAHNNKVAMELLRSRCQNNDINSLQSQVFGSLNDLTKSMIKFAYPVVVKKAAGAMGRGVFLAKNEEELKKFAKKASGSFCLKHDVKEILRKMKYRNKYFPESFYRNKFILQNYIPDMKNDWKVLVYWNKTYVLFRGNRKNDFRASGSGNFEFKKKLPEGLLDYALSVRNYFNVPHISLDIGFDGKRFHLFEFQFLNFGTTTLEKAPHYYEKIAGTWRLVTGESDLEEIYVDSIVNFIRTKKYLA